MAYKLRRPPLFSYDGSLCIGGFTQFTCKKKQPYPMECGVSAPYPPANGASPNGIMADVRAERSPAKSGLHVNFTDKGEVKERREKFLTAKYGSHQMTLIRKRLAVEMWLYDELQKLYEPADSSSSSCGGVGGGGGTEHRSEVEVDLDHLLDMDDDEQRRRHLQEVLADAKKSPRDVKKFVEDLLLRAKTL